MSLFIYFSICETYCTLSTLSQLKLVVILFHIVCLDILPMKGKIGPFPQRTARFQRAIMRLDKTRLQAVGDFLHDLVHLFLFLWLQIAQRQTGQAGII